MSDEDPYNWVIGGPLPRIARHSLAKHRVIREYLLRYVEHLTRTPAQETLRLTLIDGFAGGGRYVDDDDVERDGSPLLMLGAMEQAQLRCALAREKPFALDCEFHFVERRPSNADHLASLLASSVWASRVGRDILVHTTSFVEACPRILDAIGARGTARRAIFLLDQYGYKDVPFPLVRDILTKLPNAEIILTFGTDWLLDYLADTEQVRELLRRIGLPLPVRELLDLKGLTGDRQRIQFILHEHLMQATGARFYTPFFIRSEEAHRDYWLVHLSGHHRARDVMTTLHWDQQNSFAHYGHAGLKMLGYRPDRDLPQVGFYFDNLAAEQTRDALVVDLPEFLWRGDGLVVDDLYCQIANEMPAGMAQLGDALATLRDLGQVEIRGPGGGPKRTETVNTTDLVVPRKQLIIPGKRRPAAPSA